MKNRNKKTNSQVKFGSGLTARMIVIHFFVFLSLDIFLVVLIAAAGIVFAERTASSVAEDLTSAQKGSVQAESRDERRPIALGDISIDYAKSAPPGEIPSFIRRFLPENTMNAKRYFSCDENANRPSEFLHSLKYVVNLPFDAESPKTDAAQKNRILIEIGLGRYISVAEIFLYFILIFQALSLIHTGIKSNKAIRKTLRPLRELSEVTRALAEDSKSPSGRYAPESLKNLERALDAVSAAHPDRRIPSEIVADELRPLAAAINDMLARIDEGYNAQIRFVSDASHELRTPIAVIQGYASMLSRWGSEDPETLKESIEAIHSEAASMKLLVNQLLFLARGDGASMKLDWERLNLSSIVAEVVKEETMINQSHIFESEIAENVMIDGDAGLIKQLLRILSDNSAKYTDAGGRIELKLETRPPETHLGENPFANGRALLIVRDEGRGIPTQILPHIFDRFVRADESRARDTGGAGLGLSIAKWIAERHGGHIEVLSREGVGSRFTAVLPLPAPDIAI